jgi:hypothetical protein
MYNTKNILEDPRVVRIDFSSLYYPHHENPSHYASICYRLKSGLCEEVEGEGDTRDEAIASATNNIEEYLTKQEERYLMSNAEKAYIAYYKGKGAVPLDWKKLPDAEAKIWNDVVNSITGEFDY